MDETNIEEQALKERFGTKSPFIVPEGYFDNVASEIINSLPERTIHVVSHHNTPRYIGRFAVMIAASVITVVFCVSSLFNKSAPITTHNYNHPKQLTAKSSSNTDELADYTMLDNDQIYDYLADN